MRGLLNYFIRSKNTASVAKERLQIIISHERTQRKSPEFLPKLQQELIEVIAKYVKIDKDQVAVQLKQLGDNAVLELNIAMPEDALVEA